MIARAGAFALTLLLAACSGSQDAPRPIAPMPNVDDRGGESTTVVTNDDDGDDIDNEHDNCPLAREDWDDPVRDGCPDKGADAGVPPVPPL